MTEAIYVALPNPKAEGTNSNVWMVLDPQGHHVANFDGDGGGEKNKTNAEEYAAFKNGCVTDDAERLVRKALEKAERP